jgi:uncharacterized membrane protein
MKPTTRDGILRGGMAVLIRLLILVAGGISAYLLSVSLSGGSAVGCGPGSACDEVLQSRWAYLFGIPVSALALAVDLALLVTTFSCGSRSSPKQRRGAWEILVPCSVLVLGAALWFTAVQALVLHRFCPWCMTAHACGAVAAILLLTRVPVSDAKERRDKDPAVLRSTAVKFAVAAIVAVALLGAAQTLVSPKTYSISTVAPAVSNSSRLVPTPNLQANAAPPGVSGLTNSLGATPLGTTNRSALPPSVAFPSPSAKTLDVLGGRFRLDLTQVPVWGSLDAPLKLISLYDYTCHHCRDMHPVVMEVQRSFGDKLAVVSLPMPLDSQCNPLIRQTPRSHVNACVYAKLGLIVWRARHDAIQPFDDWLFSFQNPPPLTEVTNKALQLVGLIAFEAASRHPWVEQQLRTDIDIYTVSEREFYQRNMPQFMIGTNIISGTPTAEKLREIIEAHAKSR